MKVLQWYVNIDVLINYSKARLFLARKNQQIFIYSSCTSQRVVSFGKSHRSGRLVAAKLVVHGGLVAMKLVVHGGLVAMKLVVHGGLVAMKLVVHGGLVAMKLVVHGGLVAMKLVVHGGLDCNSIKLLPAQFCENVDLERMRRQFIKHVDVV